MLTLCPGCAPQAAAVALMPRMAQQELGNTVWALAVMDLLDVDTWQRFCACLNNVEGERGACAVFCIFFPCCSLWTWTDATM
jgi:hypothetical protein